MQYNSSAKVVICTYDYLISLNNLVNILMYRIIGSWCSTWFAWMGSLNRSMWPILSSISINESIDLWVGFSIKWSHTSFTLNHCEETLDHNDPIHIVHLNSTSWSTWSEFFTSTALTNGFKINCVTDRKNITLTAHLH